MRRVKIIGGGLAGLGLGIALRRRDVPVTIHESGHYPRHRVCGEFITSLDRRTRHEVQLNDILRGARPASGVSWCEDGKSEITHRLPQPALCLSRRVLDEAMAACFTGLGGDLRTGSREQCTGEAGNVHACGRQPRASSAWVGIKQHFRGLEVRNDLEVHFGRGGYIGLTRIDEHTVNVCGLLRRGLSDLKSSFPDIAAQGGFDNLSRRLAGAEPLAGSFCAVAGLDYRGAAPEDGFLRIGDRSALIPPFTGHGMTIALQSAVAAMPSLLAWSRREIEWSQARALAARAQRRRFGLRLRAANALHPLLLHARTRALARALHTRGILPVGLLYRVMH
jgi:flavin-dependent dehydrogenase